MNSSTSRFRAALVQTKGCDGVERVLLCFILLALCSVRAVATVVFRPYSYASYKNVLQCLWHFMSHVLGHKCLLELGTGSWQEFGLTFHKATAELWRCQGCHTAALYSQCTRGPKAHCATDVELNCFPKTTPSSFQNTISRLLGHGVQ